MTKIMCACTCICYLFSLLIYSNNKTDAPKYNFVFTHGVRMGGRASGRAAGNSLSGLYLRNRKV